MKIRYQPRFGTAEVELRDIKGGPFAAWRSGDEREIPAGATCAFQSGAQAATQVPVADAVFAHGPDFVDAATGKNPLYACACGEDALEESFTNFATLEQNALRDAQGKRQCLPCYLADHPQWIPALKARGTPKAVLEQAHARIEKRRAPAPAYAPKAPAPPATDEE